MPIEGCFLLAAALMGIGIGSALFRRNLVAVLIAIHTAGAGAIVAMAAFGAQGGKRNDSLLFALSLGVVLLFMLVLGAALAYRRFVASRSTTVGEGSALRN
jgi:NADH:ubiquinone oxidoreductase subunit K